MPNKKRHGDKLPAAVAMGRRGGKVKSEAKARAVRLNGLLGGPSSWTKPREQWKKRNDPKQVKTKAKAKSKVKIKSTTQTPPETVERVLAVHAPR